MCWESNYPPWGHFLQQWTEVVGGVLFHNDQSPRVFLLQVRNQTLAAQTQFLFVLYSLSWEAGRCSIQLLLLFFTPQEYFENSLTVCRSELECVKCRLVWNDYVWLSCQAYTETASALLGLMPLSLVSCFTRAGNKEAAMMGIMYITRKKGAQCKLDVASMQKVQLGKRPRLWGRHFGGTWQKRNKETKKERGKEMKTITKSIKGTPWRK